MVLAEALLRARRRDRGFTDRGQALRADFSHHEPRSGALLVSASAWALGITARVVAAHETPETILHTLVRRLGQPAVRAATRQAMRLLASHFVLGETIGDALHRADGHGGLLYSSTCLARARAPPTMRSATPRLMRTRSTQSVAHPREGRRPVRPAFRSSSRRSARYEPLARERVLAELPPRLLMLAQRAKAHGLHSWSMPRRRTGSSSRSPSSPASRPTRRSPAGRVRRRRAGLSEACRCGDRLARRSRPQPRPAADRAPGQGRLLGYRDQARSGTGACRLSGLHP